MRRLPPVLAVLCCLGAAHAQDAPAPLLLAIKAEQWAVADAIAAADPDPLARKLAAYYRLMTPAAANAAEISAFVAANPDWPGQAQLMRRLDEALATERDDKAALAACQAAPPQAAPALARCADAASHAGLADMSVAYARAAWVGVEPAAEAAFARQWNEALTPDDQWRRFDRLAWSDTGFPGGPAARQASRLDPARRAAAEARLALRRDDPAAPALVAALSPALRADPAIILGLARWHRRAGQDQDAARIWVDHGAAAEAAAPPQRRAAFWDERSLLTRRLLRNGDAATAYAVVSTHAQSGEAGMDAEFLSGWIALRRLNRPATAFRHFSTLAGLSRAAITQGRARYWLGRAAAMEDLEAARAAYAAAAEWPTTYYGQMAARALGEDDAALTARIAALRDPAFTGEQAHALATGELGRAAMLLVAWSAPRRAKAFLQRLDEAAPDPAGHSAAARLASDLGLPDQAVAAARRAGRNGVVLPDTGWPSPFEPPSGPVERAVVLGLMRQESSFDVGATSPAGARGLMQLMPATAAAVAQRLNEAGSVAALTADPAYNMRLGTAYLAGLLNQFGGALPLALAAYNAGPSRVLDWISTNGDPRAGLVDMNDWIELIPFNETRNYVQRVIENVAIYRARPGATPQAAVRPE